MFRLSRGAEYAVRGVLHLARKGGVSYIEEISKKEDVPKAYLAKIFQTLCKKGILKSQRGARGGFMLLKNPKDITLLDVIEAMEGPIHLNECLIRSGYCKIEALCPVHGVWKDAQKRFLKVLAESTFKALASSGNMSKGKARK